MLDRYFPLYIVLFVFTLVSTALIEKKLIPRLAEHAKQPIYKDGPKWHLKKSGTPTMGGLAFMISAFLSIALAGIFLLFRNGIQSFISLIISAVYSVMNALIGVVDDITKLKKKENAGLTPKGKLILQFVCALLFLVARHFLLDDTTTISFSFGEVNLGVLYYPIALIVLLGIVNCANLTDGIDGLASSVAFSIGVSLFYISASLNIEASIISAVIIGASIGFLLFNLHPAKIFMGDTGSLFFGSLVASCAFMLNNPLLIIFIAGVYVIEGISVIIQVVYYKMTHKRIFKMAPLHHHFEKCGWTENRICIIGIMATFIFSIPAYILYLP